MARKSRKSSVTRRRASARKMRGGAWGQGYRNEAEMIAPGYPVIGGYPSCGALSRPGMLAEGDVTGLTKAGLPGMSGGRRRKSRSTRRGRKTMRGGRYTTDLAGTAADFGAAMGPRGGMLADTMRIMGETGGSPTPCSAPAGAAAAPTPMAGADQGILPGFMKGGAQLAPAPFLQEQTAGYTFEPSKFLDSVGAPIALRTPVGGQLDVPACKTTGGGRRRRSSRRRSARRSSRKAVKGSRKASRKNRKASRKASRKNRKASRKASRKNRKASRKASRKGSRKSRSSYRK
jgi:hypothetical protein